MNSLLYHGNTPLACEVPANWSSVSIAQLDTSGQDHLWLLVLKSLVSVMQEVGLSFATVLSAFNNLQGGLFYMNSKQLQVPAPAAKSAP